ncbi:MAG: hypothetical protein WBV36_10970 [Terriglobales bacterium]
MFHVEHYACSRQALSAWGRFLLAVDEEFSVLVGRDWGEGRRRLGKIVEVGEIAEREGVCVADFWVDLRQLENLFDEA